jgi:hypothetical protein
VNRYKNDVGNGLSLSYKIALLLFVFVYPMLVSMYTMLPPLIGLAGYIFITNFNKNRLFTLIAFFYLINLDLNLTLPLFLSLAIIVLISLFVYQPLKRLIRCKVCLLFALIVIVDFSYYISLFVYDFIFNTSTVIGDMWLVYYIVIDILIGLVI